MQCASVRGECPVSPRTMASIVLGRLGRMYRSRNITGNEKVRIMKIEFLSMMKHEAIITENIFWINLA